jgi:hypothetical protein
VEKAELNPIFKYAVYSIPATILIFAPGLTDPINVPKLMALVPFVITTIVLFFALKKYRSVKTLSTEGNSVLMVYSALIISMLFSGFLGSENYIRVLFGATGRNNGLIYYLGATLIAIVLLRLIIEAKEIIFLEKVLIWTSIPFAIYCGLQFVNLDPVGWDNPLGRVMGTLGNPNFASSALASFAIFWVYLFFRSTSQKLSLRMAFLLPALSMLILSWSTDSIQGLLVFALGVGLILFMSVREKYSNALIPYVFFFGGGLLLVILFASFIGVGPLGSSLEQYTLKLRGWYASFGIKAMLDSPLTGVGVDNYISAFRTFKSEDFVSQYGLTLSSNNAHSTPAQVGASFGLVVFLLYSLIHIWILIRALRIISSRDTSQVYLKGISLIWILIFAQSLLSIEIIGLGIMNWVIGATIISATTNSTLSYSEDSKSIRKMQRNRSLPAWVGSVTIASLLMGAIPVIAITREDRAFQNVSSIQVSGEESKTFVGEEFAKLTKLTLYYPEKVDRIVGNLFQSDRRSEVESVIANLYEVESKDAYSADLLATYYKNTNQYSREILVRKEIRALDPWNMKLEIALGKAYAAVGDNDGVEESIGRIKSFAPDSLEYQEALSLREISSANP